MIEADHFFISPQSNGDVEVLLVHQVEHWDANGKIGLHIKRKDPKNNLFFFLWEQDVVFVNNLKDLTKNAIVPFLKVRCVKKPSFLFLFGKEIFFRSSKIFQFSDRIKASSFFEMEDWQKLMESNLCEVL